MSEPRTEAVERLRLLLGAYLPTEQYEECRDLLDAIEREAAAPQQDERVRYHLWISHGHDGLYGDDGEMQCNTPPLIADFLRDPLPALLNHCEYARLSRKSEADA